MLSDRFTAVTHCRDRDELFAVVLRFANHLGFDRMTAMAVLDHPNRDTTFESVENPPPAYRDTFEDLVGARRDPVMQHCKVSGSPIIWDQKTYVSAGCGEMWEVQAQHGYHAGVAMALHLPLGRHFFVGFDRDQPLTHDAAQLTSLLSDLCLFTVLAHESAFRVLHSETETAFSTNATALTPRELESLRWTMEGKTAWEVGKILNITEQTVVKHANSATHKLRCVNKHQAALKALRLGLFT